MTAQSERDGGPAFPKPGAWDPTAGDIGLPAQDGMSLRDWFAGQALAGVAQVYAADPPRFLGFLEHKNMVAEYSYAMADAMVTARAALAKADTTEDENDDD